MTINDIIQALGLTFTKSGTSWSRWESFGGENKYILHVHPAFSGKRECVLKVRTDYEWKALEFEIPHRQRTKIKHHDLPPDVEETVKAFLCTVTLGGSYDTD